MIKKLGILLVLLSTTAYATPIRDVDFETPQTYTNGNPIPASDTLTYTLYCNNNPGEQGPPYEVAIGLGSSPDVPPANSVEFEPVVNGQPGTYYCAATATSAAFPTESEYSNEANFTVTPESLGFVPNPPTNLTIQ